ncbi:sodium:proton antiporter [Candidatus Gracilibacteria bacterium]|nr:sodium:proton antiporter [Candidatus Gracilibacteria bacterium]NUJ98351.1 sodium:proton antiporter [Candidatus Gracilibacteria bacterium]NUJ99294.1 sodium:proton antiporter [Candidatus Gracilibacteria bacterium]
MEEVSFLSSTLSLLILLLISSFTYIFSKKVNFPYTVLLVIIGLLFVPLSKIHFFSFIDDFSLTPDILFFVFLPILLFEAAYNMNYRQIIKNWKSITGLAVFGLLISAFVIAGALFFIFPLVGFSIPFLVCLLFGSLISATDPVAVLSIFKSIGAPRRLTLIFEGESVANDGTSVALFLVILGIILEGKSGIGVVGSGLLSFASMLFGGILFGVFTGLVFSKIIQKVKNNELVEISLTLILAHLTFVLSELITEHVSIGGFHLQISGVISTAVAAIIIGNYGRYKISPKVEEYMEKFWGFFAFVANSLVFILMGLILSTVNISFSEFLIPIFVVIVVVMIARAISVYLPLGFINIFKLEDSIPMTWQHLLSWGSLRGALALMMVLLIPGVGDEGYDKILAFQNLVSWEYSFSIRDFILVITIGSIMFTLFIKATSIAYIMKKMKIDALHELEEFEYEEGKILANFKVIEKLNNSFQKGYIVEEEYNELKAKYELNLSNAVQALTHLLEGQKDKACTLIRRAISLHALGIEKQYLKELFLYNEIDEKNFKHILNKITRQVERLEAGEPQLKDIAEIPQEYDIFQKALKRISHNSLDFTDMYIKNRTKVVITRKVIKELEQLRSINFGFNTSAFDEIITLYSHFNKLAQERRNEIFAQNKSSILMMEAKLADKSLLKLEERVIEDLYEKEIITPKLFLRFMEEIEKEIYKDVKAI